jgi:hypothetical protein
MARRYAVNGFNTVGTNRTLAGVTSAATVRPVIYDLVVGCDATPADQATRFAVQRFTAAGTSTAFTPVAVDPGDPASLAAGGVNHTAEPTYTANAVLLTISLNQRATFRWVAAPGGELKMPATAANGLGLQSVAATGTARHDCVIHFEE